MPSSFRQLLLHEYQPLNARAGAETCDDFVHVTHRDMAVEEVVRLHEYSHTGRALIEATRGTNARLKFIETSIRELFLQRAVHPFRSGSGA